MEGERTSERRQAGTAPPAPWGHVCSAGLRGTGHNGRGAMLFLGDLCPCLLFTPTPLFAPSSNSPLQGLVEDDEGPAPLPFPPPPPSGLARPERCSPIPLGPRTQGGLTHQAPALGWSTPHPISCRGRVLGLPGRKGRRWRPGSQLSSVGAGTKRVSLRFPTLPPGLRRHSRCWDWACLARLGGALGAGPWEPRCSYPLKLAFEF